MTNEAAASCEPGSAEHYKQMYDRASQLAKIGAWECELRTERLTWTDGVYDLFEIARGSTLHRPSIVDLYHDESRREMERLRAETIRGGTGFTLEARIRTSRGADRWMRLTVDVRHEQGRPARIFGAKQDITHEKELWDRLRHLAERDALTGLANRRVFESRCSELARHVIHDGSVAALALIDLDHFKQINDRLGHAAGDECLRQVAGRLNRIFHDAVVIARMGGDEFAVLLHAPLGRAQLSRLLDRALGLLCRPVAWRNARIPVGVSVGVAILGSPNGPTPAQLFAEADSALYLAKAAGRNRVRVFGEDIGAPVAEPVARSA